MLFCLFVRNANIADSIHSVSDLRLINYKKSLLQIQQETFSFYIQVIFLFSKERKWLVSPLLSSTIVEQRPLVPFWGFCPPGTGEPKGV